MTDLCKSFIKFYHGCGIGDSGMIYDFLQDLSEEDKPISIEEVKQYLLTLPKPAPIMELNGGVIK